MTTSYRRVLLSVIVCSVFIGLGLLVWASAFWLEDKIGWSHKVFDWISLFLFFAGFMSCCVINGEDDRDR